MSSSSGPSDEAPFHVLMSSARPLQDILRHDRLQNDYLSRRFRCWKDGETEKDIWSAASPLERALTECCELGENDDDDDEAESIIRGALVKGKEGGFLRLLALHCHTAATRALALAILQRTIEQDELEHVKEEDSNGEDGTKDKNIGDDAEKGTETKPLQEEETLEKPLPESAKDTKKEDDDVGRMGRFLAAGGLKILKHWLIDAMTPVKIVVSKEGDAKKEVSSRNVVQTVASPTGPLLLLLLSVLTDMPFDKKLVTTVQINKKIRNLKKQLDEAMASSARTVKKEMEDKNNNRWTDPVAGGLVVVEVRQMVEALMKRWGERNSKTSATLTTVDPFDSLREKMRERLKVLKEYDAGGMSLKPSWLEKFEEQERNAKEAEELSKMTTEQRAARERQQEREERLMHAQKQQNESKAKRELLLQKSREESQKRKAQGVISTRDGKRTRRVRWKDGLENADNFRQRSLLEQVFCYPKEFVVENDETYKSMGGNLKQTPQDDEDQGVTGNVKEEFDDD